MTNHSRNDQHCRACGVGPLRFNESRDLGVCYNCRARIRLGIQEPPEGFNREQFYGLDPGIEASGPLDLEISGSFNLSYDNPDNVARVFGFPVVDEEGSPMTVTGEPGPTRYEVKLDGQWVNVVGSDNLKVMDVLEFIDPANPGLLDFRNYDGRLRAEFTAETGPIGIACLERTPGIRITGPIQEREAVRGWVWQGVEFYIEYDEFIAWLERGRKHV